MDAAANATAFVYAAPAQLNAASAKFVIAAHGYGGTGNGWMDSGTFGGTVMEKGLDAGYVVIAPNFGNTFGNAEAMSRISRAYNYLLTKWSSLGAVMYGFSMGGVATMIAAHRKPIPLRACVAVPPCVIRDPFPHQAAYGQLAHRLYCAATRRVTQFSLPVTHVVTARVRN